MKVKEFFDRYVHHMETCDKPSKSTICTCGVMTNLPHVFSLAIEGEKLAEGKDAIVKGLRLLQLVGNEDEIKEAIHLLKELGEPIQERPVSLN